MAGADGNGSGSKDGGGAFDSLMASLGVRPLDGPEADKPKGRSGRGSGDGRSGKSARGSKKGRKSKAPPKKQRRELTPYEQALRDQERKEKARQAKAKAARPAAKKAAAKKADPKKAAAKKGVEPAAKPAAKPAAPEAAAPRAAVRKATAPEAAPKTAPKDQAAPARAELTALQERVAALQEERDQLTSALDDRERAAMSAQAQAERLSRALARATGDEASPVQSVAAVLSAEGVKGPTEIDRLLSALAEARLGADLLSTLSVDDPAPLAAFLAERTIRLGGCAACPQVPGRVRVEVPKVRCELCGGDDLAAARRRFMDGALVNGLTRIAVVGGSAKVHRILRTMLEDRRLRLVLVPGTLRRTPEAAASEVAGSQVVLRWSRGQAAGWLLPEVSALYDPPSDDSDGTRPPVRDVDAPHLAAFLVQAGAAMNALLD